jgi:hypothetical protein
MLVEVAESPVALNQVVVVDEKVEQRGVPVGLACSPVLLRLLVDRE